MEVCISFIFLLLPIIFFLLLKYTYDSYRENKNHKRVKVGSFLSLLVAIILLLIPMRAIFNMGYYQAWSVICSLPFLILPVLVFTIYYLGLSINEYRRVRDIKKLSRKLIAVIIILLIIIATIYVSYEYLETPDANQKYVLTLEQNQTSEAKVILPNLVEGDKYFPINEYNVVKGEGKIQKLQDGEYIQITTSSDIFKIKYSEEAKMFSRYHEERGFQYDELRGDRHSNEQHFMNITYNSEKNASCHLRFRWVDNYASKDIGGRWCEVRSNTYIDEGTQSIKVQVEIAVV